MTVSQTTLAGAVLVAIDIAKHRHEVLLELPGRRRRQRLTVLNTRPEHDRLVELLCSFAAPIVIGFEATGNYHRPLAHRLLSEGFELRLICTEVPTFTPLAAPSVGNPLLGGLCGRARCRSPSCQETLARCPSLV